MLGFNTDRPEEPMSAGAGAVVANELERLQDSLTGLMAVAEAFSEKAHDDLFAGVLDHYKNVLAGVSADLDDLGVLLGDAEITISPEALEASTRWPTLVAREASRRLRDTKGGVQ